MILRLYKLLVTGPNKEPAELDFHGLTHLVYGPTDTGKSHIVECIRYCLGGGDRPENVGYSEGYTRVVLHIKLATGNEHTIFRNLVDTESQIYMGFHIEPPQDIPPLTEDVSAALVSWAGAIGKKIVIKSGHVGNLIAGDLRRVSIFGEIETLNKVVFEGKDTNLKLRNKSALSLILTGADDANIELVSSTAKLNIAKGHVEAVKEELADLKADIPIEITKSDAEHALLNVSREIDSLSKLVSSQETELELLKKARAEIERENQELSRHSVALMEAQNRFLLLNEKYTNDLLRLEAIGSATAVVSAFEGTPCPLCLTDIHHQVRHKNDGEIMLNLRHAAAAEIEKIKNLQNGLRTALSDITDDLQEISQREEELRNKIRENLKKQDSLLSTETNNYRVDLVALTEGKTSFTLLLRDLERVERLEAKLKQLSALTKRKKQVIERDISTSANLLCTRIKELLVTWRVPDVESVYFDESVADIEVNQRKRISYGKGKRGIFLTAYMVALMEIAIKAGNPHPGFLVIDSPVVTYKDPKHGKDGVAEDLLELGVKDGFYSWLATREEDGQIIVLENEEPDDLVRSKLPHTEFFGIGSAQGRNGFYPTRFG
jgi:hypothetical protein